jgi:hypothetical protein
VSMRNWSSSKPLPHAFWNNPGLPESNEADHPWAAFFNKHVAK